MEGLRDWSLYQLLLPVFDLLRVLATVATLTLSINYPSLQICILFVLSVLRQTYLLYHKPLQERLLLTVFNELLVTGYLYFLLFMTDANQLTKLRDVASYGLVVMVGTYSIVNLLVFCGDVIINVCRRVRKWCHRRKLQKMKAKIEDVKLREGDITMKEGEEVKLEKEVDNSRS